MRQPPPFDAVVKVIPTHWTPQQALAAWECVRAMQDALWALYGTQMQQAWCAQLDPPEWSESDCAPEFDPDAPF